MVHKLIVGLWHCEPGSQKGSVLGFQRNDHLSNERGPLHAIVGLARGDGACMEQPVGPWQMHEEN
jgi:hypothetical protein